MSSIPANKEQFSWPQADFLSVCSPQLTDWRGNPVPERDKKIVQFDDKRWFVKFKSDPEEQKRDYLAYLLGCNWVNIAEVRTLSESEFGNLRHLGAVPEGASAANTFLVRLCRDYTVGQLPNTDIDAAVARELVFSLWIRRRDTHAANRRYVDGVPIFFDHQTAFLGEPGLENLEVFFGPGPDAGYASQWRVKMVGSDTTVTTEEALQIGRERGIALHFAQDLDSFNKCIQDAVERVQSQSPEEWLKKAIIAGFNETRSQNITTFLENNSKELDVAIDRMRKVIFQLACPRIMCRYMGEAGCGLLRPGRRSESWALSVSACTCGIARFYGYAARAAFHKDQSACLLLLLL